MHKLFKQYNQQTFEVLRKCSDNLNGWKILSDPLVCSKMFKTPQEMKLELDKLLA
jgi:hypothetical protein